MNTKTIAEKAAAIDRIIYAYLPQPESHTALITEAVSYSVKAGGKRIRPMLMQETYRLFRGEADDALLHAFMAAIEFIHTYSLVHDDLPAMDNDEYRRGQKATHAAFGEAFGILAGDALLNQAFETALNALLQEPEPGRKEAGIKALAVLAKKAGVQGMIGGQSLDVYAQEQENFSTKEEELLYIYRNKTSALLEASMMVGALLAGAKDEEVLLVEQIASDVGIAFQIQDDILDATSTTEALGKPVGSDEKNQKVTYLTFAGMENAQRDVKAYSASAIARLSSIQADNSFLQELILYLMNRDN